MQHVSLEISPGCFAAPLTSLGRDTMPAGEHFVRSHFGVPQLDPDLHAVEVTGLVKRSVRWTLNDFRKLSQISTHVTLECAGHRRMELDPPVPGVPWQLGAVSHARWAGAQLADLFEIVRPLPEATHIVLSGADVGDVDGRTSPEAFARAIPLRDPVVREMILAEKEGGRRRALDKLLPMQRADFAAIFRIMAGLPVTIRLLDPPLHEFLPHSEYEISEVAASLGTEVEAMQRRMQELSEANPMLGHRGCRLGISYPEIYEMQARAIFEAAAEIGRKTHKAPVPEIMIPLVATKRELEITRAMVDRVAQEVFAEGGYHVVYSVGTMIELPRAALTADAIATVADFFSFGTNDLTQTTFGLSRDDAGKFLPLYIEKGIFPKDPFVSIDPDGVGALVRIAAEKGRSVKPDIKLGICGEHGGDPSSIHFCESVGLDYVSCSPYRVPVARLAAAQAALQSGGADRTA